MINDCWELCKQGLFCDIVLIEKCRDSIQKIPAHKLILFGSSEYFKTLFTSGYSDNNQKEITIETDAPGVLEIVLQAIYTNGFDFIELGQLLNIDIVMNIYKCCEYLQTTSLFRPLNKLIDSNFESGEIIDWWIHQHAMQKPVSAGPLKIVFKEFEKCVYRKGSFQTSFVKIDFILKMWSLQKSATDEIKDFLNKQLATDEIKQL